MGQLSERGQPLFGRRTGFSAAYPTVENATVRFIESDLGSDVPANTWNLASSGPRMGCRNSLCYRGGYDFEMMLGFMVDGGEELKDFNMPCDGDEGSPKGRKPGKNCTMSIKGTINVTYRKTEAAKP